MEEERRIDRLIRWPAVGLLFVGLSDFVITVFLMVSGEEIARSLEGYVQKEDPSFEVPMQGWSDPANLALTLIGLLISVLVVIGGALMINKRSWPMALVAAILTMIPCFGPCCGVFFPIGIWTIVVLMKPEVKAAMK